MRVSSPKCADECVNFFVKPTKRAYACVKRCSYACDEKCACGVCQQMTTNSSPRSTKWFFNMAPNSPKNSYSQNIRTLDLMELDRSRFAPADRPSTRCSDTLSCCGLRPLRVVFHFHFSFHFSEHISVRFFLFVFSRLLISLPSKVVFFLQLLSVYLPHGFQKRFSAKKKQTKSNKCLVLYFLVFGLPISPFSFFRSSFSFFLFSYFTFFPFFQFPFFFSFFSNFISFSSTVSNFNMFSFFQFFPLSHFSFVRLRIQNMDQPEAQCVCWPTPCWSHG